MISDILPRYQEVADGIKTSFTVPFDVLDSAYIEVYLGNEKQLSGYTISNKTITFTTAPGSSTVVTIIRHLPISWEEENLGGINSDSLNRIFTNLVAKMQTLEEGLSRSVKTAITDTENGNSFLSMLDSALDSLTQANVKLAQIQTAGTQALSDINDAKGNALSQITSHTTNKTVEFNSNATSKTNVYNSNADDKLSAYNSNATSKVGTYNSNADSKLSSFNSNAAAKQTLVDNKASEAESSAESAAASALLAKQYADSLNTDNYYLKSEVNTLLSGKQNTLTFDNSPTQNSDNPVKSGGIYTALAGKQSALTFDSTPTQGSSNPVTSNGVYVALSGKQNTLTFDTTPTQGSSNPVTSGGLYTVIGDVETILNAL